MCQQLKILFLCWNDFDLGFKPEFIHSNKKLPFIFLKAALSNWLLGLWFWTEFLWQSPYFKDLELACFKFFFQWSLLSVVTVASPLWCCSFFLYTSCNYKKKKKNSTKSVMMQTCFHASGCIFFYNYWDTGIIFWLS